MRLISICPSNTEIIEFLGLAPQLVGIDDYSDWPASIQHLPKLGPDLDIDMEKVEALQPDLVIASLSVPGMEKNVEQLRKRDIPHIVTNPQSLFEIGRSIEEIADACGISHKGRLLAESYEAQLERFRSASARIGSRPSVYWEWWPKPVFTPGSVNWLTEISELAGASNVFKDKQTANYQTDWEEVRERNPDFILLSWVGVRLEKINPAAVLKRPGWSHLSAVQQQRVSVMEESLFCRPSPRLVSGLDKLSKLVHPEVFQEIELDPLFQNIHL
ncbi:cobalamin-binding protein [Pseudobacillus badius]|uniref:cobalamin-binding protein n=1 Tax=Bacillus badius TaxID=1455 RepID=UPI0007B0855B|nr:cobalamin-binding protein [Bacillus badius]KZO00441.1 cobalamin-binding protein [Bacillus badius]OCS86839.1 cobalamin-binding protein [Bacillus badius]OVE47983.1 cobalamin-binding protein [Bacillus badius]TDV99840.1 iron complex transport system substrate-binding protein [Bacillus badius]